MIEARGVSRRYGSLLAVDRVSFAVRAGEVVGLLGPNGAGKTTLMKILTGYHFPHEGQALIGNRDIVAEPLAAKQCLGYLPENSPLYSDLTVTEYLEFICGMRGLTGRVARDAQERVIALCELQSVLARPIVEISKGYRQRVGLAQALVHDPSVVILDEPSSGLDPNQIQSVRRIVRDLGRDKAVLLSTHVLGEVEAICDRVLILDHGQIVAQGTADEIGREMRGSQIVEISLDGEPDAVALRALEPFGRIIGRRSDASGVTIRLDLEEGASSDVLFDWAVGSGLRLRSLVPESYSLEEIFHRLTTGGS